MKKLLIIGILYYNYIIYDMTCILYHIFFSKTEKRRSVFVKENSVLRTCFFVVSFCFGKRKDFIFAAKVFWCKGDGVFGRKISIRRYLWRRTWPDKREWRRGEGGGMFWGKIFSFLFWFFWYIDRYMWIVNTIIGFFVFLFFSFVLRTILTKSSNDSIIYLVCGGKIFRKIENYKITKL